jgi:hypothetical protein
MVSDIVIDILKIPTSIREANVLKIMESHVGKFNAITQTFYFTVFQTLIAKHVLKPQESLRALYNHLRLLYLLHKNS